MLFRSHLHGLYNFNTVHLYCQPFTDAIHVKKLSQDTVAVHHLEIEPFNLKLQAIMCILDTPSM